MMALTRVKPVVSHCAVDALTDISAMMDGSAGVTRVWLSTVMNVPKIRTTSVAFCLLVNFKWYLVSSVRAWSRCRRGRLFARAGARLFRMGGSGVLRAEWRSVRMAP